MKALIAPAMLAAMLLALSACTNPYDPAQRAIGGGLIGAGTGAAIGAAAAGGHGAAIGAAVGGAAGVLGGIATTPPPPAYGYAPPPPAYGYAPPPPRYASASRRCGPGRHWVRGHHNRLGRWVPGHCARNR